MFEKVNPKHPDKIADRIAGAIVDIAYLEEENPRVAVEVLIGHGTCLIIVESNIDFNTIEKMKDVTAIVKRIAGDNIHTTVVSKAQDSHLAQNQSQAIKCGDNGIFRGVPVTDEQKQLKDVAMYLYDKYNSDGKYIINNGNIVICQSNADTVYLRQITPSNVIVNPLGNWHGGLNTDTGATNRKLGSDMGDAVTGGGLHGKDLSKADVSVNIYAHLKAQMLGKPVALSCAIGDETVDGKPYAQIVGLAREYIRAVGGFEKFAEWGLI